MSQKTAEHPPAESLLDFIRGALERAATERIGRHLAVCRDCREFVERSGDSSGDSAGDAAVPPPTATVAELPAKPPEPPVKVPAPTPKPTSVQVTPTPKPTEVQVSAPPPPKPAAPEPMKAEAAPPPKPATPPAAKTEATPPPAPKPPAERHGDTPQNAQTMGPVPRIEVDGDEIPPELRQHPRYELRHKLGAGGMGVVFLAQHKVMERLVALKVLHQSLLSTPETVERFRREARAAARLDHPNIVKAFDAETVADWQILVMEFVEGRDLADATQHRGPFSVLHACNYAFQVAMGLQHAHEMDMVHRDLKPQNLMLTSKGVVKILDFGLAKLTAASHQPGLTTKDVVIGTPEFIAPEQARDTASADIRSDIYSLGCTLYYFLTGEPPFQADTPVATVIKHLGEVPPRLESVRPDAPPELCALYWRMMSKDPSKRPQTPLEVAEALRPFAVKPGSASSYDSVTLPPPEPIRTPYLKYALMFGLLLAAGAGAGVLLPRFMEPKPTLAAVKPPVEKPPVEKPPVEKPPVEKPPVEKPPVEKPPVEKPSVEKPPVEKPPVENAGNKKKDDDERKKKEADEANAKVEREKEAERKKQEEARLAAEATARMEREKKEAEEAERKKKEEARLAAEAASRMEREKKEAEEAERKKKEAEEAARKPKTLESLYELKGHKAPVTNVVFLPNDKLLSSEDRQAVARNGVKSPVIEWDLLTGNNGYEYEWHHDRVQAMVASLDGKLVATRAGKANNDLEVWDPVKKRHVVKLFGFPKTDMHLAFSSDAALLGSVDLEEKVIVWSKSGGPAVRRVQAKDKSRDDNPVTAVALRADDRLKVAASGLKDGTIRFWNALSKEGETIGTVTKLHAGPVTALAFAPKGQRVVSVSAVGSLRVTEGDKTLAQAETGNALKCVAWTPDGTKLITGGEDGLVRVWEVASSKELFRGTGHAGAVTCVAVAADGKTYASGGEDTSVRVWSLKTE